MPVPILYIINCLCFMAGTEKHLFDLLQGLDKKRFKPLIVTFLGFSEFTKKIEDLGIPVKVLRMNKIYGFRSLHLFLELNKFIRKEKIKIIQTFHPNPDIYGTVLAKFSGVPVVISSRRDMGFNRNGRHLLCYRLLNPLVDSIIAVSGAVKRFIVDSENIEESKIHIIYNGIREEQFGKPVSRELEREKLGIEALEIVVGMVANFRSIKGHNFLLQAVKKLKDEGLPVKAILVGTGSLLEETQRLAYELGIGSCVQFLGHRSNIPQLLSAMDIIVAPSLTEGFSNTIIEALYMGKPVIATKVGGNPEIIFNEKTGLLIEPSSSAQIASALKRLIKDKEFAAKLAESGRKLVKDKFTLDIMVKKTEDLYYDLLKKKRVIRG